MPGWLADTVCPQLQPCLLYAVLQLRLVRGRYEDVVSSIDSQLNTLLAARRDAQREMADVDLRLCSVPDAVRRSNMLRCHERICCSARHAQKAQHCKKPRLSYHMVMLCVQETGPSLAGVPDVSLITSATSDISGLTELEDRQLANELSIVDDSVLTLSDSNAACGGGAALLRHCGESDSDTGTPLVPIAVLTASAASHVQQPRDLLHALQRFCGAQSCMAEHGASDRRRQPFGFRQHVLHCVFQLVAVVQKIARQQRRRHL